MKPFDPNQSPDPQDRVKSIIIWIAVALICVIAVWYFGQFILFGMKASLIKEILNEYGLILSDSIW